MEVVDLTIFNLMLIFIMDPRKKHILIGVSVIIFFFLGLGGVAGAAYLSGFAGEFGRLCLALITSPFLMETSIFVLALTLLFAVNGWRRIKEGDDYVTLDENCVSDRLSGQSPKSKGGE